jgi:two-component system chemotaxis response regulator CheB
VRTLKRGGCYSITQSENTCVVYGMPRAVDEAGLSDKSLALEAIPAEIEGLLKNGRR